MRILGFAHNWDKLSQETFTTFRFTRKDRDWEVGEQVKVVLRPRRKGGGLLLGMAEILSKDPRRIPRHGKVDFEAPLVTNEEANADGFPDTTQGRAGYFLMWEFLYDTYGPIRLFQEPMNKLTLRWVKHEQNGH